MFRARLDILPEPQRRLWDELSKTPPQFVLYGGTALALRLGHRQSLDFDFFTNESFTPEELLTSVGYLNGAKPKLSKPNTLTCLVERGGAVRVSYFGGLDLNRIKDPETPEQGGVPVASLIDLAATKVKVVQDRASARDYTDVAELIDAGVQLETALSAALAIYGETFNPLLSLKALSFFEDGDLDTLTDAVMTTLSQAVPRVEPSRLSAPAAHRGLL